LAQDDNSAVAENKKGFFTEPPEKRVYGE